MDFVPDSGGEWKTKTEARLFTNPCFDLQLYLEALRLWIKVAQMRFPCRMPNLTHHSTVSPEIWKDFGIEPLRLLIERSWLVQPPGPVAPSFLGMLCMAN